MSPTVICGVVWGIALGIAGFGFHDWKFWLLVLLSQVTFQAGRSLK